MAPQESAQQTRLPLPESVKLVRPEGSHPRLIAYLPQWETVINAALDVLRVNNPARAPVRELDPKRTRWLGLDGVDSEMFVKYRAAGLKLDDELSEARDQKMTVDKYTDEVTVIVRDAQRQLLVQIIMAKRELAKFAQRDKRERGSEGEPLTWILHTLAYTLERVEEGLVNATNRLNELAKKVDGVTS